MMPIHDPRFRVQTWTCPVCGATKRDENQPECPADGTLMKAEG